MNSETAAKNLLITKFNKTRVNAIVNYFFGTTQKFIEGDWEGTLVKSGKFIEAIVKLIWTYAGKTLPKPKEFKAGAYARKIIDEIGKTTLPHDEIRLQIPRGCIFLYDITSNRGGRHDAEEFNPNEMDSALAITICSWILAELVRFSAKDDLSPEQAKFLVDSITQRRYPFFEEIDGQIYIQEDKYETALECAILILFVSFPRRVEIGELSDWIENHGFKMQGFRWDNLDHYTHIDKDSNVLLRSDGRQRAKALLSR